MTYEKIGRLLALAKKEGAVGVTLDLDAGRFYLPLKEALREFYKIAPGDPFGIVSIHWEE